MKTTKTVFAILLSVLLLATTIPFAFAASGADGNITWTYDEAIKTLTISGTGPMPEHSYSEYDWYSYHSIENVVINSGVTSVGPDAFKGKKFLNSVTIPDSVTSIGESAFWNCGELHSLKIPASVSSIGEEAFMYCSLYNLILPDRVTSLTLGKSAFEETSIHNLVIPEGVTAISERCFFGCNGIVSITIPASVTSIGDEAFCYCCDGLKNVYYTGTQEQWNSITFGKDVFLYYSDEAGEYANFDLTPLLQFPCHWCGGFHTEGFFQKLIAFFHNLFAAIFGNKY